MRTIRLHQGFSPLGKAYRPFRAPAYRLCPCIRYTSTKLPAEHSRPPSNNHQSVPPASTSSKHPDRLDKLLSRTPKFLRKWIQPIANKPLSHITSFLLLHEITAVVPLIGLTYIFHKAQWTPPVLPGEWMIQGVEKGAKLIRHYGINVHGDQFVRLAFEFAAAYASVKVLLPVRIALSVWLTPWFARWTVIPFLGLFKRKKKVEEGRAVEEENTQNNEKVKDTKE